MQDQGGSSREERVRQRAHAIWMQEGQPEGREDAHWQMAERLEAQSEDEVDEASKGSFPASDPPSHTPVVGERRGTEKKSK